MSHFLAAISFKCSSILWDSYQHLSPNYFMALNSRFVDSAIWSEKNTVRVWVKPEVRWIGNYRPFVGDTVRNRLLLSCL